MPSSWGSFQPRDQSQVSHIASRYGNPLQYPGKSHGPSSLVGYSPWDRKELDMTEQLDFTSQLAENFLIQSKARCQLASLETECKDLPSSIKRF